MVQFDKNMNVVTEEAANNEKKEQILEALSKYMVTHLMLRGIDTRLTADIEAISRYMIPTWKVEASTNDDYSNTLCTSQEIRKKISEDLGLSEKDVTRLIYKLTQSNILIPMVGENGKKVRTYYYVANWVPREDEWESLLTLGNKGNKMAHRASEGIA